MVYHVSHWGKFYLSTFGVIHYIGFRAIAALLTALLASLFLGKWFISTSQRYFRSKVREYTPVHHKTKDDMPTMGGVFILLAVFISVLLWCNLADLKVWIFLFCLAGFALIGGIDDWYKIKTGLGISAKRKSIAQLALSFLVVIAWLQTSGATTTLTLPFLKTAYLDLGVFFLAWALFIIIGCSNAVNLTDGLDGLAIGCLIPNFILFSIISYFAGHAFFANYLHIPFAATSEIAVIGASLVGASLGFLWYNCWPAQIFMGDVGSLSLGAGLALMALMAKQEFLLALSGGVFVVEALSVILQVGSVKLRGKRLFKMAPIHHHFELLGWPESRITVRFGIISSILCVLALMVLKLR